VFAGAVVAAGMACAPGQAQQRAPAQDPTKVTVTSRAYDRKQLLGTPALSAEAYRGRAVWLQRCAYCHDGVGQPSYNTMGPWIGAETLLALGDAAFRAIVSVGTERMPGFQYALQPQQIDDLITFLTTVSSDQKPTPAQLAGRAGGGPTGSD
jgi:mono/diheme cytochrome c family protein